MAEILPFEPAEPTKLRKLEITSQTVEITAKTGKKIVIDEIIGNGAKYVDILVGTKTLLRVPIEINDCKFTTPIGGAAPSFGILNFMRKYVKEVFITVPEGEKLTLKFDTAPTKAILYYYEIGKDEKIGDEWSNGLDEKPFVALITHSSDVAASGTYNFDTAVMPTGALEIANETRIPANVEFELKVISFGAVASGATEFTHLHIWQQDQELFTPEDHVGLSVSTSANELKFDITTRTAFVLSKPVVFKPGQLISLYGDATYDGTNTLAAESAYTILIGLLRYITK